ncbi:MAG: hypothetical protein CL881_06435 [Dehalococcoidia bacterium]|nr:hypothetical protein [Dehalococcoidia bacterium]
MPIFEFNNSRISIPENHSYVFIATPHGAEWHVVPHVSNVRLVRGERYKVECRNGSLVVSQEVQKNPQEGGQE